MNRHLEALRLQRGAEHLHICGPRAIAEYLAEVADRIGGMPAILNTLCEYERLDPVMLRRVGGDRLPPRFLHVVPKGEEPHR
jgi:hypothetical protein